MHTTQDHTFPAFTGILRQQTVPYSAPPTTSQPLPVRQDRGFGFHPHRFPGEIRLLPEVRRIPLRPPKQSPNPTAQRLSSTGCIRNTR
jgi:hypothetical protein